MRLRKLDRVKFLPGTHIEEINRFAAGHAVGQVSRLDLHCFVRFVARRDMFDDFVDVDIFVACANARERFFRAEPAAAATADMIFAEQGALGAGKLQQQFLHCDIGIDGGG